MPLINCKIELKLKLTTCVLSVLSNDNTNANENNIIAAIEETSLYAPASLYQ